MHTDTRYTHARIVIIITLGAHNLTAWITSIYFGSQIERISVVFFLCFFCSVHFGLVFVIEARVFVYVCHAAAIWAEFFEALMQQ